MTPLKMYWQVIQGRDGNAHLNMHWESAGVRKLGGPIISNLSRLLLP